MFLRIVKRSGTNMLITENIVVLFSVYTCSMDRSNLLWLVVSYVDNVEISERCKTIPRLEVLN